MKPELIENRVKQVTPFSMRFAGDESYWNSHCFEMIHSGDAVELYCHSLGLGPYSSIAKPPTRALPVLFEIQRLSMGTQFMRFFRDEVSGNLRQQHDEDRLSEENMRNISSNGSWSGCRECGMSIKA